MFHLFSWFFIIDIHVIIIVVVVSIIILSDLGIEDDLSHMDLQEKKNLLSAIKESAETNSNIETTPEKQVFEIRFCVYFKEIFYKLKVFSFIFLVLM